MGRGCYLLLCPQMGILILWHRHSLLTDWSPSKIDISTQSNATDQTDLYLGSTALIVDVTEFAKKLNATFAKRNRFTVLFKQIEDILVMLTTQTLCFCTVQSVVGIRLELIVSKY